MLKLTAASVAAALAFTPVVASAQNVLRFAPLGDALTLDPHGQNESPTIAMNNQMYESLVRRDPEMKLVGELASSWGLVSPTVWEFKLRPGVTFHDGSPFTAEDVVFSLGRALSPTSDFKTQIASITEVKAIDAHTVHIVTGSPSPILPEQLNGIFMMSKGWAEKNNVVKPIDYKAKEQTFAHTNTNGTGPFRLVRREQDVRTVLEKNPTWWGLKEPNPHNVDRVEITPVGNAATRVAALLSGEVDLLTEPPLQDLPRIERSPELAVKSTPHNRTIFLGMDLGSAELRASDVKGKNPLADVRVRRAMYQAIDAEAIKSRVMRGYSFPAGQLAAPMVKGAEKVFDTRLPYDPEASKRLLTEAGYPNGFQVKLDCPNDRYINDEGICQAVVGMLARANIRVQLDSQSKSLHFPKIQTGKSDFYMLGWGVGTFDSHYVFSFLYQTKSPTAGGWNFTGYSNPRVDALTVAMDSETDAEKRASQVHEAWKIVTDDIVYLPIHHQVVVWAMNKRIDMPVMANEQHAFRYARFVGR